MANAILITLDDPTDLVMKGNPDIPSRVGTVADPRCYLYRTNAGAIGRLMNLLEKGMRPHLIGGGADVVEWCEAALDLQAKPPRQTYHSDLSCFENWDEVVEYAKTDEGDDIKLMVKLITEFGAEEIKEALTDMPDEKDADAVISTAHKSKGREWTTVKLGQDFPLANKMSDPDRKLLYVAATRAQHTLDISECPPFCGGHDTRDTGNPETAGAWIPGLEIEYTVPMPTEEEQAEWLAARDTAPMPPAAPTPQSNGWPAPTPASPTAPIQRPVNGKYTWTKHGDAGWCVRGPAGTQVGAQVTVEKRDGSTQVLTVRKIVRQYDDAWIYGI